MEPLNSIIAGEPQSVNANVEASQTNTDGLGTPAPDSIGPDNVVNSVSQTDSRSEICVSPSWQTDRERRERKKELKRIAKEKKELERSSKSERSSFNEPRRLTKKQPSKTPSRASSIKSILPRSSTAPSILGFWSNSTSKPNSTREKHGLDASTPEGTGRKQDDSPEHTKPLFTGHLPQRFGGKITRDPEYDKTSSRAFDSDSSPSTPVSPPDKPRRHLHMAKKHADLRAAAKAFQSADIISPNTSTAPPRSSWSQELTRRLSNSNGRKLQRRSLKTEYEPHMYSSRRSSANKENENGTICSRKTRQSVPSTPTSSHFHTTAGISSPSPQNCSRITVVEPHENINPPDPSSSQQDHEASNPQHTENNANRSSEQQETSSTISMISPSNRTQKTTYRPTESHRKHGRSHSWSEILTYSDRIAGVSLKRRAHGRESSHITANGDVEEFKTSGPYESNYGPSAAFRSHAAQSDPSLSPASWLVTPENIGAAGDFPQVQPESFPSMTPTELPIDPIDTPETATITDSPNMELAVIAPSLRQRENPMRIPPKIINRDVPFKSSPLAGPPLNNQDEESTMESGNIPNEGGAGASSKSNHEKLGFSFSRILRHGSKKEKNSAGFSRRYSMKGKLVNTTGKAKLPKVTVSGSNVLQKQQDTSELSSFAGSKPEITSRPTSASSRQLNLCPPASNDMLNDIKIPPKSPKRNSGIFPTPTNTRPSSASGVETMSISSNGTETPGKKKRSISIDINKNHIPHGPGKERYILKPSSGHASPTLSSNTQSTTITSSFPPTKQATTNSLTSSDSHLKASERHHQIPSGPTFDSRPDSSSRRSFASNFGNGRVSAQHPARRGTPVAKMFVICCQCRYWHDMPSDVYAKLAFPNGPPPIEHMITDDSHSPHQHQHPMASSGFVAHGGGSSSTFTETSSGGSNNAPDNKSPRCSRPSSSSSSSSNNFTVTCCWCAHRMVKTCCAGWTTIVYLHERHH
ncbi:predicted protein [Histoplasma capsulatum H143]|uniref:Uncharacterized protein n=1 Tax=Ajellomyces capsulatus (strain H143) TaxID=544712 RepID=C6H3U0_AJECH|nr:predicted protein [Histoplasma capsulatum H143]